MDLSKTLNLSKTIQERCSIRNFTDKKPSREQLMAILEAARLAPSCANVQPWHFIVVQDPETIKLLGHLSFDQPHVLKANTLIVCCGTQDSWETDKYKEVILRRPNVPKEKVDFLLNTPEINPTLAGNDAVLFRIVEEVTYAIAYMTLEIENQGLASCIIGAMKTPMFKSNPDIYNNVCKKLNLPDTALIIAMLVVGYANEEKTPKVRKELSEIVSFNRFGNPF